MDYYRFLWILIKNSRRSSLLTGNLRFYSRFAHRRTGNFSPGGAVNYLPKKFSQVAHFFYETVKKKWGSYDTTT